MSNIDVLFVTSFLCLLKFLSDGVSQEVSTKQYDICMAQYMRHNGHLLNPCTIVVTLNFDLSKLLFI